MVYADKYDKNRVQHLLEQPRGASARPGIEDRRQMPPTRSAAAVPGRSAGLTIEPNGSRRAVSRVRERIGLMKKLAGTNWGATL